MDRPDLSDTCRLCLGETVFLSILDETYTHLQQKILECVDIEVRESDRMPKMICKRCFLKVEDWYDFKKSCEITQFKLQTMATNPIETPQSFTSIVIKEEPHEEEEVLEIIEDDDLMIKSEWDMGIDIENPSLDAAGFSPSYDTEPLLIPTGECPASLHSISDPPERCRFCDQIFHSKQIRLKHERDFHNLLQSKNEKEYIDFFTKMNYMVRTKICTCCDLKFMSNKALFQHIRKKINLELYTCYHCWLSFGNLSHYRKHLFNKRYCKDREKLLMSGVFDLKPYLNFKCMFCLYLCGSQDELYEHIESHCDIKEPTKCPNCSFMLLNEYKCRQHLYTSCISRVHCAICKITYMNLEEFNSHCAIHDTSDNLFSSPVNNIEIQGFYCNICKLEYKTNYALLRHLKIFHNDPAVTECRLCPESTNIILAEDLAEHRSKCHNDVELYNCQDCPEQFANAKDLETHAKQTHSEFKIKLYRCFNSNSYVTSSFMCGVCNKRFKTEQHLKEHAVQHQPEPTNQYNCDKCDKSYKFKFSLAKHKKYGHKKINKSAPRRCKICNVVCENSKLLYKHTSKFHSKGNKIHMMKKKNIKIKTELYEKKYSCEFCEASFNGLGNLSNHIKTHQVKYSNNNVKNKIPKQNTGGDTNGKTFPCLHCAKVCVTLSALINHGRTHNLIFNKRNKRKCKRCKKEFSDLSSYAFHLKSKNCHTKNSKLACRYCKKTFPTSRALNGHMNVHSKEEKPKVIIKQEVVDDEVKNTKKKPKIKVKDLENTPLDCSLCGETFCTPHSFISHKGWHQRILNKKESKKYPCTECNQDFTSAAGLNQHQKAHGIKYTCDICQKEYSYQAYFKKHLLTHNDEEKNMLVNPVSIETKIKNEKEYKCTKCNIGFPNSKLLRIHILTHEEHE